MSVESLVLDGDGRILFLLDANSSESLIASLPNRQDLIESGSLILPPNGKFTPQQNVPIVNIPQGHKGFCWLTKNQAKTATGSLSIDSVSRTILFSSK